MMRFIPRVPFFVNKKLDFFFSETKKKAPNPFLRG